MNSFIWGCLLKFDDTGMKYDMKHKARTTSTRVAMGSSWYWYDVVITGTRDDKLAEFVIYVQTRSLGICLGPRAPAWCPVIEESRPLNGG